MSGIFRGGKADGLETESKCPVDKPEAWIETLDGFPNGDGTSFLCIKGLIVPYVTSIHEKH